jgi:pyrimidine operon attenuation protein/uracil phosphoribosyltransferase
MGNAAGTYRKLRLMDGDGMTRVVARMAREIVEEHGGTADFALVGIRTRGVPLAQRLAAEIERTDGVRVPVGLLDITLYRDDLTTVASSPVLKRTEIPFPVEAKSIVLCDDVLFTGRTVRAALDAILDFGRPRKIVLAVLVDRGRRELPIEAQYVGKRISTSAPEIVSVTFLETDGGDDVWLLDREPARRPVSRRETRTRGAAKAAPVRPRKAPRKKAAAKQPAARKPAHKKAPRSAAPSRAAGPRKSGKSSKSGKSAARPALRRTRTR